MLNRLTIREQRIFGITILCLFVFLSYNGVFKPMKEHSASIDAQIVTQKRKLKKNMAVIKEAKALDSKYDEYAQKYKQTEPNEQVMSSILSEIEGVARKLELRISDLKPKRVRSGEYYNQFSVSLTIDSYFTDIVHFLHMLQNQPHLFDVEEVSFDKGSRRKSETLKTRLVLRKIYIP